MRFLILRVSNRNSPELKKYPQKHLKTNRNFHFPRFLFSFVGVVPKTLGVSIGYPRTDISAYPTAAPIDGGGDGGDSDDNALINMIITIVAMLACTGLICVTSFRAIEAYWQKRSNEGKNVPKTIPQKYGDYAYKRL